MDRDEISAKYDKFRSSKQEALRLELALQGYALLEKETDPKMQDIRCDYRAYLKKRIRPALMMIASAGSISYLPMMYRDGIISDASIPALLDLDAVRSAPAMWITLLNLKNRKDAEKCKSGPAENPKEQQITEQQITAQQITEQQKKAQQITEQQKKAQQITEQQKKAQQITAQQIKTQQINEQDIKADQMLRYSRSVIYDLYPFLDAAVLALSFKKIDRSNFLGTDGIHLLYDPFYVIELFSKDPSILTGLYLHTILHCVFRHWETDQGERLADLQVLEILGREQKENKKAAKKIAFQEDFSDDHSCWPDPEDKDSCRKLTNVWKMIAQRSGSGGGKTGSSMLGIGLAAGDAQDDIGSIKKGKYDYRSFLKSFAVRREEMELDLESFDYIYYSLGMEYYKNMPLIEPLEYKEGHKLEELVIAIDTSGSCSTEMVRRFLEESYRILCEKENFFRTMKVYIIQCDCTIQDVALVRNEEDWTNYCTNLKIYGRSGTNFKPVFVYVDKLIEQGDLKNLKGLIYFTDGNGTFPTWTPNYKTAFVFVQEDLGLEKVPEWALQLHIGEM